MKKRTKSFINSAKIVFSLLLVGKVLGLLKQVVLANFYGTSESADLFFSSYSFISEISSAFFSAISIALLKKYGEEKKKSKDSATSLLSSSLLFFSILSLIICVTMLIFSKGISTIIAPGFDANKNESLSVFIRLLSPVVLLYAVRIHFSAVLDYEKNFLPGKCLPLLINTFVSLAAIIFGDSYGVVPIIIAVLLAYLLQLAFSMVLAKKYIDFKLKNPFSNNAFLMVVKNVIPLTIGNAILELNAMCDRAIASNLSEGAISSLTYGASVNEIVTTLIIGSVASIFYSYISSLVVNNKNADLSQYFKRVFVVLLVLLLPITVYMVFFSKEIAAVLFMRGNFDAVALENTSLVISGYAIGFIPVMVRSLLTNIHYAYDDMKNPMLNGIITVIMNIILNIVLSNLLGVLGIAVATSISMLLSSIMCFFTVRKYIRFRVEKDKVSKILKLVIIMIFLLFVAFWLTKILNYGSLVNAIISFGSIMAVYIALLIIFGFKDTIRSLTEIIKKPSMN